MGRKGKCERIEKMKERDEKKKEKGMVCEKEKKGKVREMATSVVLTSSENAGSSRRT